MEENYCASICYQGIQGGAIKLTKEYFIFRSQKLTMPEELKNIKIPYSDIKGLSCIREFFVFPIIRLDLSNGGAYSFWVLNRKRFIGSLQKRGVGF